MNTYLINLPDQPERLAKATAEFRRFGIKIEVFEGTRRENSHDGLRETILRLLDTAPDDDLAVFEDDVQLRDDFPYAFRRAARRLPPNWAMLYLGGMTCADITDGTVKPAAEPVARELWRTRETVHTEGIVIAREARTEIRGIISASSEPYDIALTKFQRESGRVYACIPRLCWQRPNTSNRTGGQVPGNTDFFARKCCGAAS